MNDKLEHHRKLQVFRDKLAALETREEYIDFFKKFLEKQGYIICKDDAQLIVAAVERGYTVRNKWEEEEIRLMRSHLKDLSITADSDKNEYKEYIMSRQKLVIK